MVASSNKIILTELGNIPEDWSYSTWGEVLEGFTSGATPYRAIPSYYSGKIKWVSSGELEYNTIYDTIEHISDLAKEKTSLTLHPVNTFLMAITGLEAEGTRGSCALLGVPATTNQSCMAIYGTDKVSVKYLFHFYCYFGETLAFRYCQGTKQQSYTAKIVKKLPITFPKTKEEQNAIAEALSDANNLIASLERLIAKKTAIMQGVMQELLMGKKRLPGFSREWKQISIGNELYTRVDYDNLNSFTSPEYTFEYITLENVDKGTLLETIVCQYATAPSRARRIVHKNDVLFGTVRPNLHSHLFIANECKNVICSTGFCVIGCHGNMLNAKFLYYKLFTEEIDRQVEAIISGSNYPALSSSDVKSLKIMIPSSIEEQVAISSILSDMDAEIEQLEKKLGKYRLIKQGIMQELLTGRKRLVKPTM